MSARRLLRGIAIALIVTSQAAANAAGPHAYPATGSIELAFTPGDAIDNLVIGVIEAAQHEILVHAYTFTHRRIAQALVDAKRRGVAVAVLADREQARAVPQNVLRQLADGGVAVWLDGNFSAAHNKVIVVDADSERATTVTGSFNFTLAAQRNNAENVVVLRDNGPVARAYRDNWRRLKANAVPWQETVLQ